MKKQSAVLALVAVAATVTATLGVGAPATAAPHQRPDQRAALIIKGDMELSPMVRVLRINAQGMRDEWGRTTGTYRATVLDGANPTAIQVLGPVTCISVAGSTASLLYPISDMRPFGLPEQLKDVYAVQVTAREGRHGHPGRVGLMGPRPTNSFHGCAPQATPNMFRGIVRTMGH